MPRFDLTLTGGAVVDGSPDAIPRRLDVGILGGRITALGDLGSASARATVDVGGRIVTPGFIDPHTHLEPALLARTIDAEAPLLQGVTTCLSGPDGFGWAPLAPAAARDLWTGTAGINGAYPETMGTVTVDAYLRSLEGGPGPNVLPMAPLGAIRFAACGWRAGEASPDGVRSMRDAVRDWMANGAAGISAGLDYEPGARASEAELTGLCAEVGREGGTLAAHVRYQDAGRQAAWREVVRVAAATGVGLVVAHETLDAEGWDLLEEALATVDVSIETYPYPAASTHLAMYVSAKQRAGGPAAIAERLHDRAVADGVAARLDDVLGAEMAAGERFIYAASAMANRVGVDLADAAREVGTSPGRVAMAVLRDDPDALFVIRHPASAVADATAARTITHRATIVASDGIYRPGQMHPRGYGTFPRVLRTAFREQGVLTIGEAVHRMTQRTATRYRVPDRGVVAVGRVADLVVLDPATVADRATWDEPRLAPAGIEHVLIAGDIVIRDARPTGVAAGRILAAA